MEGFTFTFNFGIVCHSPQKRVCVCVCVCVWVMGVHALHKQMTLEGPWNTPWGWPSPATFIFFWVKLIYWLNWWSFPLSFQEICLTGHSRLCWPLHGFQPPEARFFLSMSLFFPRSKKKMTNGSFSPYIGILSKANKIHFITFLFHDPIFLIPMVPLLIYF